DEPVDLSLDSLDLAAALVEREGGVGGERGHGLQRVEELAGGAIVALELRLDLQKPRLDLLQVDLLPGAGEGTCPRHQLLALVQPLADDAGKVEPCQLDEDPLGSRLSLFEQAVGV